MRFFDLKKSLTSGVKPIYCLFGNDRFFISRGTEFITSVVSEPSINLSFVNGEKMKEENISSLISDLYSMPFMSEYRAVVVKDALISEKDYKKHFLPYFNNPNPSTILIIIQSAEQKGDFLKKHDNVIAVDCDKGEEGIISKYIVTELKKNRITAEEQAVHKLCEYTLCSMSRLTEELKKLIAYVDEGGTMTAADVELLVSKEFDFQMYEMTNELAKGNVKKALIVLKDLQNKGIPDQILFVKLYSYFRNLLEISVSEKTNAELAKILGVKEYAVKMMRIAASRFSKKHLKKIVEKMCEQDFKAKSGAMNISDGLFASFFSVNCQ